MAHKLPAGQPPHPQPQDDFPFLLLCTILAMTVATKRTKTALIMIVAIFSISHVSIEIPPALIVSILRGSPHLFGLPHHITYFAIFSFIFVVSFVASL